MIRVPVCKITKVCLKQLYRKFLSLLNMNKIDILIKLICIDLYITILTEFI